MVAAGLLALSFFTLALGAPTPDVMRLHDRRAAAPAGYQASGAADPDTTISLSIALKTDDAAVQNALLDVSTPGNANYRKFLTKAEVRTCSSSSSHKYRCTFPCLCSRPTAQQRFECSRVVRYHHLTPILHARQVDQLAAPSSAGLAAVNAWLAKNNVTATQGATSQWLRVEVPVATANTLLDADFTVYSNPDTGATAVRTLAYSVPKSVQPFLDFVYPATA